MLTVPRLTGVLRVVLQNEINSAKDAESEMKLSNKNGEIIKIDNSRLKGGMCYSKNDFIKKWGSELPASHQNLVCFEN